MADERQQLADIAAVVAGIDLIIDRLFASVADLKATLGITGPVTEKEADPLTHAAPPAGPDPGPPPGGALAAIGGLQGAIEAMSEDLQTVSGRLASTEKRERLLRHVITGLCTAFVLDVALTIGVAVATAQAHSASSRANATVTQLHSSNLNACRQGNVTRGQDAAVWSQLLSDLAPAKDRTPAVRKELAGINRRIAVKDTPRDCPALYRTKP